MQSLQELKTICQTTAKKDVSNVYMRYVCRSLSIFVTRALIPTPVTPNQVSFVMIVTGTLAALFFLCPDTLVFFAGTLVLQFWYILDCVDGELARYRDYEKRGQVTRDKTELPITGGYWDYLNHYIVHGLVPLGMSYGYYARTGSSFWLFAGYIASISQTLLLAVHDTKSRAFIGKLTRIGGSHWIGIRQSKPSEAGPKIHKRHSLPKWIFMILHYSCTFPTVMNVITLGGLFSVLGVFGPKTDLRGFLTLYYAGASLLVFLGLAAKNLRHQGVDHDFDDLFEFKARE